VEAAASVRGRSELVPSALLHKTVHGEGKAHHERVKASCLFKSNRLGHALYAVLQGQVSSFMNIRQFIASALNSLCFNLRFELHTS